MIRRLVIQDFVRIERLELELGEGLTVLTGGSGEGKSLLLEALAFGLGETAGGREAASRLLREGAAALVVELEVDLSWRQLRSRLAEAGIPAAALEGERLLLSRALDREGRSRLKAGQRGISLAVLRRAGGLLAERFRQGQAQRLTESGAQRELLDGCAKLGPQVERYGAERLEVLALVRARDRLAADEVRLSQAQAIHDDERRALAALEPEHGEYEALVEEQARLEAFEGQRRDASAALAALEDREGAPLEALREVLSRLDRVDGVEEPRQVLADGIGLLDEAAALLEVALERLGGDPGRLAAVRDRRGDYQSLARRLGLAPEGLAPRWADLDGARLEGLARSRSAAEATLLARWKRLDRLAGSLGTARREAAQELVPAVEAALVSLGLPEARFELSVLSGERVRRAFEVAVACEPWFTAEHGEATGPQRVEIGFAPDAVCPPGPLARASGGELSRIFLALGRRAAAQSGAPLLIVDEVDQNVGARLGGAVGRSLAEHAVGRQVLAVTHLAPVAAQATTHLRIRKQRAALCCERLVKDARLEELALMLAGQSSAGAISQARELLGAGQPRSSRKKAKAKRSSPRRGRGVRARV